MRKAGNRLRITAQLVSADDGFQVWSAAFDRDVADVFAVQDEIVVRKPDVPLIIPVTRKEYVQQFRTELAEYNAEQTEAMRALQSTDAAEVRAQREAALTRSQAAYLQAVDNYLTHASEDELARTVSEPLRFVPRNPDNPAVIFLDGDRVMVTLNPEYMTPKVPHHVPQFIVIRLSARAARFPWETNLRERISAGLDFDALRKLVAR